MATQSKTSRPRRAKSNLNSAPPVPPTAPPQRDPVASTPKGKLGALVALLRRPEGALIADLTTETGWQAHSVRGAISGAVKKKLGLMVASEVSETGRRYRIVEGPVEADT